MNFSEILIEIHQFLLKKMHLKMLSGKQRPFCLCLNVLMAVMDLILRVESSTRVEIKAYGLGQNSIYTIKQLSMT